MNEENNFFSNTALPIMLFIGSLFLLGYIIYSLIVLPIKFMIWSASSARAPSDNIFVSNPITIICYGAGSILATSYGIELLNNKFNFNAVCHLILSVMILAIFVKALSGVIEELKNLHAPAQVDDFNYNITVGVVANVAARMMFGAIAALFLVYYIITK